MATPRVSETPEVQRQYVAQLALSAALAQTLRQLWTATSPLSSERAMQAFRAGVAALVVQFAQAARVVATDYYVNLRRASGMPDVPTIRPVDLPPTSLVDAGIDWAMRDFMNKTEADIMAKVEAAMSKAVLDVGREQIVEAVEGDDLAVGFRRVPRPDACYWCISLALRKSHRVGLAVNASKNSRRNTFDPDVEHFGVYRSRESAGQLPPNARGEVNRYHNHCHCAVEPVFMTGVTDVPDWLLDMDRLYESATADSAKGERLNDFRRALDAWRRGETPPTPTAPTIIPAVSQDERLRLLSDFLAEIAA